jgi:predicted protein tyrosine phosphatase
MSFPWFSLENIEAVPLPNRRKVALVSISSGAGDFADRNGFGAVLRVHFEDLTPEAVEGVWLHEGETLRLFTEGHARAIWRFVLETRRQGLKVWIHCLMGISRSAAVAAALGTLLEGDGSEPFERALPNPHVYRIMLAVGAKMLAVHTLAEPPPTPDSPSDSSPQDLI